MKEKARQNLVYLLSYLSKLSAANIMAPDEAPEGTTTRALLGVLQYIVRHRPFLVWLENVRAVEKLFTFIHRLLREAGYVVHCFTLEANRYFAPESRLRCYIVAVHRSFMPGIPRPSEPDAKRRRLQLDLCERSWAGNVQATLDLLTSSEHLPLAGCLMPLDSEVLRRIAESIDAPSDVIDESQTWCRRHDALFKAAGYPGRPGRTQRRRFRQRLRHAVSRLMFDLLSPREQDLVIYCTLKYWKDGADGEVVVDVSQDSLRLHSANDMLTCLTTNSRPWLVRDQRLVSGLEMLCMQGMTFEFAPQMTDFADHHLRRLAGNAFCAPQALAMLTATALSLV